MKTNPRRNPGVKVAPANKLVRMNYPKQNEWSIDRVVNCAVIKKHVIPEGFYPGSPAFTYARVPTNEKKIGRCRTTNFRHDRSNLITARE